MIWYNQRMLVYPSGFEAYPRSVDSPKEYHLPYEDVELVTKDKVKLRCYLIRRDELEKARGTVIMFHGNAMNHGEAIPRAAKLFYKGFNVLTVEYRGSAAIDYILTHPVLSDLPIIIYGQSLGGGVAIHAASKNANKLSALIVENTFTSIPDLVKGLPLIRRFSWLCTQRWKSASKMAHLPTTLPILMLSGLMDEVIPFSHMENLWKVAKTRGRQKRNKGSLNEQYHPPEEDIYRTFPYGTHNSTFLQFDYWETILEFLDNAEARGTIIVFHGNSCDRGDLLEIFASQLRHHYNIFAAEYRGYGRSEGTPTEKGSYIIYFLPMYSAGYDDLELSGLCLDAQAAVDYIIYGHSLGGAVAIHVTSENGDKIDALVVENTFTSLSAVIRDFPVVGWPLSIFCTEKWPSRSKIKRIPREIPILLLGGMADKLVRPHQMRSLWRAAKNRGQIKKSWPNKSSAETEEAEDAYVSQDQFILFPDGDHRTTHEQGGYWTIIHGFLDNVIDGTPTK
ncbi:hypothetical protein CVT25_013190 [Psilocybe cyanescens]|uniref:Serine aminopeptidase S33 domain-containing protein n=1 Tax=Psilocybe cyanescens TaxID=93625 RepID=A0A409XLF8_PSICY|nr:hypothetical protein CVT25_013190 [Psilocybe cyanescens]